MGGSSRSNCFRHGQVFPSRSENILLKLFFGGWVVVVGGCFWHLLPWDSGAFAVTLSGFVKKESRDRNMTGSLVCP